MRKSLSTMQRLDLFLNAKGQCQRCGWRLLPGTRWEVDHVIPLSLGGTDEANNLQVLCQACHGSKTAREDLPALSKVRRMRARHLGAHRPSKVMPGARKSTWRKRMDGSVERRFQSAKKPMHTRFEDKAAKCKNDKSEGGP